MKKAYKTTNQHAFAVFLVFSGISLLFMGFIFLLSRSHLYPLWLILMGIGLWAFWKGNKISWNLSFCDHCKCDLDDSTREKDISARICQDCYQRYYAKKK